MILEHAVLDIREGEQDAFETAFAQALPLIAASPGFHNLGLSHCLENDNRYLLLVEWRSLADHEQGFRGSAAYQEWIALLHHFYDPFPVVEHYTAVLTTPAHRPENHDLTPDPPPHADLPAALRG